MYQPRRIPATSAGEAARIRTKGAASSTVQSSIAAPTIEAYQGAPTRRLDTQAARQPVVQLRSPRSVLIVALALGVVADLFFYSKPLGVSVPIFALLMVGTLFLLGRREGLRPVVRNLWLLVPLAFFAVMVFVRANAFLTFLNVTATLCLLGFVVYFFAADRIGQLGLFGFPLVPLLVAGRVVSEPRPVVATALSMQAIRSRNAASVKPVLRGLAFAAPVLLVFTLLLSSADMVFADYMGNLLTLKFVSLSPDYAWHSIIILGAAWLVAGGLVYALHRGHDARENPDRPSLPGSVSSSGRMGATEAATVLVAVNLLFMVFVVIQFSYLFAGRVATTMADLDYRHYARRGFGELIVVTVLTLGMILGLRWLARHERPQQIRVFNLLSTHLVILTSVILASAWLRMLNWEAVADYLYTDKRLYVRVFIAWLAIVLVWFIVTLWTRPNRFALGVFLAALGFLATLNVMNPDADVVEYNVARAYSRDIYVPQMDRLSEDAVPLIVAALDQVPPGTREELRLALRQRLTRMKHDTSWRALPAFHLARAQAYDALMSKEDWLNEQE